MAVTLAFTAPLHSMRAEYDISYAIFGVIGHSSASLKVAKNTYTIHIEARAAGIAKLMSNNRVEIYESRGTISEGRLIPDVLEIHTKKGEHFSASEYYHFDYAHQKILHVTQMKDSVGVDEKKEVLSYFAKDDILTLFFNLPRYLKKNPCITKTCIFRAIGANKKDGNVDIQKIGKNFKVRLHRRIFASKEGEMMVHLTPQGICDSALLKDVIFFGDVKSKATKIVY